MRELFPPELVEQAESYAKEKHGSYRPDRPGDGPVLVYINADKKDTYHDPDSDLVPPFRLALSTHGISHHTHSTGTVVPDE
jgi:hypothetical protein